LRKRSKEIRGLLRMVRPGFSEFSQVNSQLRNAAIGLSPARDAEVMLDSFDTVTAGLRDPSSFSGLRAYVLAEVEKRRTVATKDALPRYTQVFAELDPTLAGLTLSDKASHLIWAGVKDTWHRARKRHRLARGVFKGADAAEYDAAPFHEWRKSVKHHWYQARFLHDIAPRSMARHIARIATLDELLGTHNDLDTLIRFLMAQDSVSDQDAHARQALIRHAMRGKRAAARDALELAHSVFAPPPAKLSARWQKDWRSWRQA
jgi:CHAD domain-containing protein